MLETKPYIVCKDGVTLSSILLEPENPKAVVQINGGTGFPKEFYLSFARFLAEQGFVSCVFDYRGTCASAPEDMRHCEYTFLQYGTHDMPAVLDYLDDAFPNLPKLQFGHSVGGQQIGFMPNYSKIKGLITFATSVGYMGFMPWGYRLKSIYFFRVFARLSILYNGYVAAKKYGIMEDLPRNVVKQWDDWCSVPEYFFNPKYYGKTTPIGHFQDYPFPVYNFWATDDPISNSRSIPMLWKHIKSSVGIEFRQISPQELGVPKINHMGFFKKQFRDTLWVEVANKFTSFIEKQ
jgi:predicted alpha/beta hydrolase